MCLDEETFGPAKQGAHVFAHERLGHPRLDDRDGNVESPVARLADDGGQCADVANDEAALSSALALPLSAEEGSAPGLVDTRGLQ